MPYEGAKDGRHYWLTPPELFDELDREFNFDFDPCPYPRPEGFDGLEVEWGESTYVNPPFKGPTAWVRKALAEHAAGKNIVFVFPVDKWVLLLLEAGAKVRNLKDVKWCATEDGKPGKGLGRHIAMFVLDHPLTDGQTITHNKFNRARREAMDEPGIEFGPLSEIVDTAAVAKQIVDTLGKTKERFPVENQAKQWIGRLVDDTIAEHVQKSVHPQIEEALREAVDTFALMEGDRPEDQVAAVAWDEKIGEAVEKVLSGGISDALGQGWLGENTIGPKFHEPDTITRIATEAAVGVGKHYGNFSTAEALGLNTLELEALAPKLVGIPTSLDRRGGKNAPAKATPADKATRARVVLSAVAGLLAQHDPTELIAEIDLIGDFDEVLSPGAAERLGIKDAVVIEALKSSYADAAVKRTWAATVVKEAQNLSAAGSEPQVSEDAVLPGAAASTDQAAGTAGEEQASTIAPPLQTEKPKGRRRGKNTVTNTSAVAGLNALLTCMSHQEASDLLKCTKSTITNYKEAKTPFAPTTYELETLTGHATKLRDALNLAIESFETAALE